MEVGFGDALVFPVVVFTISRWSQRRGEFSTQKWRWYLASIATAHLYRNPFLFSFWLKSTMQRIELTLREFAETFGGKKPKYSEVRDFIESRRPEWVRALVPRIIEA